MRVLIVDDSTTLAKQLGRVLTDLGHVVVGHATNGVGALKLISTERPDVVFLDLVMPEMDGLSTLRALRQVDGKARVIVLSSVAGVSENVESALRLGAAGVLTKPFVKDDIERALTKSDASA